MNPSHGYSEGAEVPEDKTKHRPDFPQWLETEGGKGCMSWPVSEPKHLQNRLFWAFDAGRNCVWDMYIKKKNELTDAKEVIKDLLLIADIYKSLPEHNKISLNATEIIINRAKESLKNKPI